jgi:CheY-like chemotaxis protein
MRRQTRSERTLTLPELQGRRVLVAEDEYMLADDLRRELGRQGAEVMGPAGTLKQALDLLRAASPPDLAILDVNLQGEMVYRVADALRARGVPFVFVTGYATCDIPEAYADVPRLQKPIEIKAALAKLVAYFLESGPP